MYYLQNKNLKIQFLQEPKQETNEILITQVPKNIFAERKKKNTTFYLAHLWSTYLNNYT